MNSADTTPTPPTPDLEPAVPPVPAADHAAAVPPAADAAPPANAPESSPPAAAGEPAAPAAVPHPAPVAPDAPPAVTAELPRPTPPPPPALPPQPVPQVPPAPQPNDLSRLAQDLQIRKAQVEAVVQLLDEGNTVPFMTRYRKERTGGLDEVQIRRIQDRITHLRELSNKKQTVLRSIANQGKLTDELTQAVLAADNLKRVDDLYLPYKPKKKTLASDAREKGLEPLALAIWNRDPAVANLSEVLPGMVDPWKQLHTVDDVLTGVRNILAEVVAELADVRGPLRAFAWDTALLVSTKTETVPEGKGAEYRDYFDFKEPVHHIPPHRILAVNRGEREQIVRVRISWDAARAKDIALDHLPLADHPHRELLVPVVGDALERLLMPSLEREVRRELTEHAQDHAVDIFARNLRSLLMRAPLGGQKVLAIDPGIRTGCKVAVLDETGTLVEDAVVYPHAPQKKVAETKLRLEQLIRKYGTSVIAIGNGTACRETEQIVSDMLAEFEARRLNPPPAASPIEPVTAATPHAIEPAHTDAAPPVHAAAPAATHEPLPVSPVEPVSAETTLHTSAIETTGPVHIGAETAVVSPGLGAGETDVVATPAGAAESSVVHSPAIEAPAKAPAAPAISMEGLPEPPADIAYVIVNEAGASDYSASPVAKDEFPTLDATTRGTISIGRRLQDPLAELVKIDPQHVGVGLYQHDVRVKYLKESVEAVIESCVNGVGVDLNTASVPLLRHVSGLNQLVARELVEYRKQHGPFATRDDLKKVPQMGDARFTQAAGFLKIRGGDDPLDATWVHPESYPLARQILADLGFAPADLRDKDKLAQIREKLKGTNPDELAAKLDAGPPTVRDIFEAIARPGRDPRDDRPQPIFRKGVLKLEDLKAGMELKGEVLNVVDFGAFVDVGLKDSGLVHISQMANRYIKSPYDVIAVGDVVSVWVMTVDPDRRRVSLSMIQPGQERRPQGGGGRPPQGERQDRQGERHGEQRQGGGDRPPRGNRPPQDRQGGDRPPQQFADRPPQGQGHGQGQGQGYGPGPGPRPPQGPRPPMGPRPEGDRPPQGGGDRPPQRQFGGPRPGGGGGGRPQPRGPGAPGWRTGPKPPTPPTGPQPQPGGEPAGPPAQGQAGPGPGAPPVPPAGKKPPRPRATPKISDQQKTGKEPVYSFAQLAALLRAKDEPPPAPPAEKPTPAPEGEAPAGPPPAAQAGDHTAADAPKSDAPAGG